ncbi:MAG: hypothetical protein ACI9P5_001899 [Saprospiraceae bacterium]|jgi:hypothetical protein
MKYTILLIFSLSITFFSCEAKKEEKNPSAYEGLWELTSINGGFAGSDQVSQWEIMKIDENIIYLLHEDNVIYKAEISINTTESFNRDRVEFDVEFNSETPSQKFFDLVNIKYFYLGGDQLNVSDECCDFYDFTFLRI